MRKWLIRIPLYLIAASILVVLVLRWVPVRFTPLMLKRACQFCGDSTYHREQKWVSLEEFSPELLDAVVLSEDHKFYAHHGFDWKALGWLWRHRNDAVPRMGGSTISQQTAKNVFTFGTRTFVRKAAEAWWTLLIELIWGKDRILEVYLNVVETGRGLYGAAAAAEHYFSLPVSDISPSQAVSLAVCLPSPLTSTPLAPLDTVRWKRVKAELEIVRSYPQ